MKDLVKELTNILDGSSKNKTSPYDANGVVKRIDGDTAWVRLNGGVDETPVKMSIACQPGDTVQVRVSGGSAYIAGNTTAPPTDDKVAKEAAATAAAAYKASEKVQENVDETNESVSDMAQILEEVQTAQESTNNHFWFDNTGVYVTEQEGSASSGYATRITNQGILQTHNGDTMSSWTNSGVTFFDYNGSAMASFARSGVHIYENGVSAATFGVSSRVGVSSADTVDVRVLGTYGNNLSPGVWLYHNGSAIGGITATQVPSATTTMKSIKMVGGDTNAQSEVYAGASKLGLSLERYASYSSSYKAEIVLYPGSTNTAELGTVKINTDNFTVTTAGNTTIAGSATIAGNLTLGGHSSTVGTVLNSSGSKSIASGTSWTGTGVSLSLGKGSWIITFSAYCELGVKEKRLGVRIYGSTTSTEYHASRSIAHTSNGSAVAASGALVVNVTNSSETFVVQAFQGSGSAKSVSAYIRACRIC